jgi:hypothetical protein
MRVRRLILLGLATVAMLTLVGTSSAATRANPRTLVLGLHDLPSGFGIQTTTNYTIQGAASDGGVTVPQLRKWGYVAAYEIDFARIKEVPKTARGIFGVFSFANTFASTAGAHGRWAQRAKDCKRYKALTGTKIGDASRFCSGTITVASRVVQAYFVIWTHGNAFETLIAYGNKGRVAPSEALTLAKRQDARLR